MKPSYYVIEFRSGSFFRDLEAEHGCSIADARRFDTREQAEHFMGQHEWILFNGGMAKEVRPLSKENTMSLSDRDKTPAPSGYGYIFHHTDPQRRVPCIVGDMLAPRSADDIPPISPEAMASVQAALRLLADLVADRDHGIFLGSGDAKLEEYRVKARDILLTAKGLAGILRVEEVSS